MADLVDFQTIPFHRLEVPISFIVIYLKWFFLSRQFDLIVMMLLGWFTSGW